MEIIHPINNLTTTSCLPLSIKRSSTKFTEVVKSEIVEPKRYVFMSFTPTPLMIIFVPTLGGGSILTSLNWLFSALG